jgi:hypothetical protein
MFSSPSSGEVCKPADVNGHLLIIRPTDIRRDVPTAYGTSDAIVIDLVDLNDADRTTGEIGRIYRSVLWFPVGLVNGLRDKVGQLVLAWMGQGTAKPGQSAPWTLIPATGDAAATKLAGDWITTHPAFNNLAVAVAQERQQSAPPTPTGGGPLPVGQVPQAPAAPAAPVANGIDPTTGQPTPEAAALLAQLGARTQ